MYGISYKPKKVIRLAPDAIILINESAYIQICPKKDCSAKINISDYVTSITTDLSSNGTVGTANFTLAIPRHGHAGNYLTRSGRIYGLNLMSEVEIYFKSRFPNKLEDHSYYKCFWGVITSVNESYSDGVQTITISCESMLKWLLLMKTNEHPALQVLQDSNTRFDQDALLWAGKSYAKLNPYQIVYQMMSITYANIIAPTAMDIEKLRTKDGRETSIGFFNPKDVELMEYWKKRFQKLKGRLRMFGTTEKDFSEVADPNKVQQTKQSNDAQLGGMKNPTSAQKIFYNTEAMFDFKPFYRNDQVPPIDVISNSYKNNLDIINEVKLFTGFEFYLDTVGEFIFKPPFWNMDVRNNTNHVIEDADLLGWEFMESEAEIKTRIEVTGQVIIEKPTDSHFNPRGVYTDYKLARQFGMRTEQIPMGLFKDSTMCYHHAISELDRFNANRFKGTLTIIGRPELRLGMPVYIKSRDSFVYVTHISHSFSMGGSFTTTIGFEAMRRKYIGDNSQDSDPDKTKKNSKYPGIRGGGYMLLYKQPDEEFYKDLKKYQGLSEKLATVNKEGQKLSKQASNDISTPLRTNRAGEYEEVPITNSKVKSILKEMDSAKKNADYEVYLALLDKAIPVSDEDGYDLVGIYENGRSIYLDNDNKLKKKGDSFNDILYKAQTERQRTAKGGVKSLRAGETVVQDMDTMAEEKARKAREKKDSTSTFLEYNAKSLADLRNPKEDKDIKACTCFDVSLSGKSFRDTLGKGNKKLISKISKDRRG